jgi:hypothetical protein
MSEKRHHHSKPRQSHKWQPELALQVKPPRSRRTTAMPTDAVGIDFVPLAVDTLGGWDPEALFHFKWIAHNTGRSANLDACTMTRHLFQRLSLLLQRGNAIFLADRNLCPQTS